jgi:hypothetical protein
MPLDPAEHTPLCFPVKRGGGYIKNVTGGWSTVTVVQMMDCNRGTV